MLKLRNTLTKKIEPFISLDEVKNRPEESRFVSIYTCGPTVYDYASIGNFSAYLMADLVKRYLKYLKYPVKHVINITDVGHLTADADVAGEDKLEAAAKKEGTDPAKIAAKYTEQFLADAKALDIAADVWPKATDHIPEMIRMIETLIEKGCAYVTESGVYFDVTKDSHYGELSGNSIANLRAGERVEVHPDKRNSADFALWKLNQPNHLMQWDSPWGKGYPGWHIECSAMSTKYLGDQLDIHTGGEDNIFPHHECEIAQSECATGKQPFVRFWLHRQFLTVDGQKMSKSLGNIYRLHDLIDKDFEPEDFRMFILSAHYRTGVNFTWEALAAARERRLRWKEASQRTDNKEHGTEDTPHPSPLPMGEGGRRSGEGNLLADVVDALDNDLNTPEAFALVDEVVKRANKGEKIGSEFWQAIDSLFALGLSKADELGTELESKRQTLDSARAAGDYSKADTIRSEIEAAGYTVQSTATGTIIRKK